MSKNDAIVIIGERNEFMGVHAEHKKLAEMFGIENADWKLLKQELRIDGDKSYDVMYIQLSNGETKEIWFDITDFYGKRG